MSYRSQLAEIDLGNLLYQDKAPLDRDDKGIVQKECLIGIAKECTFHFFRQFWALPAEPSNSTTVTSIPKPSFRLPREKRIPAQRDLTRWERFARLKGIQNRKKSRKVWDPDARSWKPRWGKGRIDDAKDKWVLEVPDNADPYEDQFEKLTKARNERRAKNELQRLKNIARSVKPGQAPPIGVLTESQGSKNELTRALSIASVSDASLGRFAASVDRRKVSKTTEKKFNQRRQLSQVIGEPPKRKGGVKRFSKGRKETSKSKGKKKFAKRKIK